SAARYVVSTTSGGLPLEYEERPFEWVAECRFSVRRVLRKGLIQGLSHTFSLADRADGGTDVTLRLEVEPKHGLLSPIVRLQVSRFAERIEQELHSVDAEIVAGRSTCFHTTRSSVDGAALERVAEVLLRTVPEQRREIARRLVNYVREA